MKIRHKPQVHIACWVTHAWRSTPKAQHIVKGNWAQFSCWRSLSELLVRFMSPNTSFCAILNSLNRAWFDFNSNLQSNLQWLERWDFKRFTALSLSIRHHLIHFAREGTMQGDRPPFWMPLLYLQKLTPTFAIGTPPGDQKILAWTGRDNWFRKVFVFHSVARLSFLTAVQQRMVTDCEHSVCPQKSRRRCKFSLVWSLYSCRNYSWLTSRLRWSHSWWL